MAGAVPARRSERGQAAPAAVMPKPERELLTIGGREVAISNPNKVLFPEAGHTKLDLVRYYLTVSEGALRGRAAAPMCWCATRMASAPNSFIKSARLNRGRTGSRWWR